MPTPKKRGPKPTKTETALARARVERGLTIYELAEKVGVSKSQLLRIEKGEATPTKKVARALYALFDEKVKLLDIYDAQFSLEPVESTTTVKIPQRLTFEELNQQYAEHKNQTGHDFVSKLHMIETSHPRKPFGCSVCFNLAQNYIAQR